jgi:hypothetical protein
VGTGSGEGQSHSGADVGSVWAASSHARQCRRLPTGDRSDIADVAFEADGVAIRMRHWRFDAAAHVDLQQGGL